MNTGARDVILKCGLFEVRLSAFVVLNRTVIEAGRCLEENCSLDHADC